MKHLFVVFFILSLVACTNDYNSQTIATTGELYEKDLLLYSRLTNKPFTGTYVDIWDYVSFKNDLDEINLEEVSKNPANVEYNVSDNFAVMEIKEGKVITWKQWRDKKLLRELSCNTRQLKEWDKDGFLIKLTILNADDFLLKDSCGLK